MALVVARFHEPRQCQLLERAHRAGIETKLVGDLYLAPFYNYELAETRGASRSRAQSTFGLSLSYNKSFDLF